ncbi:hypothetical protein OUZ56_020697 [Daphnia magna]|uniref:Uncharacterized protein n=1 Tax=Daphnia magna TaxID=35525 RepID=A0ABQ9ZF72_9CRUS|nr:hypothetical protein OUZ56_020697 [Daphnia magna]
MSLSRHCYIATFQLPGMSIPSGSFCLGRNFLLCFILFSWIENHISTSKHLPTVSLYGIGNKGIRGSHLPFWSNMFISTTGHMATPKSQWKESIVNEAWRIKNCLIGTRYVYSNKLAIYTLKVQKVPKHVNGARVIIYWQNIGNEDCSCCTCCIITYSKVSVTSWSHEEFLTLLQLIAWFIQSYDCTVVDLT